MRLLAPGAWLRKQAFVEAGVQHVVCVNVDEQVRDDAAVIFTRAFYLALIAGKTVQQSFDIGKVAVLSAPDVPDGLQESQKFLLLPAPSEDGVGGGEGAKPAADHNRCIFADAPPGDLLDTTRPPAPNNLPTLPDHFLGRTLELHQVALPRSPPLPKRVVSSSRAAQQIGRSRHPSPLHTSLLRASYCLTFFATGL